MKKISYSQLSLYNECPYHWKLRYIDNIRTMESNIYLIFGSAMHTTLQIYLDKMYDESIKSADELNLEKILQEELITEFKKAKENDKKDPCTRNEINEFFDDGLGIIKWFKKRRSSYFKKQNWELLGCEIPLDVELKNGIRFIGYMDVVLRHIPTNRIKIIDIKTSSWGWNKYQKANKNKTSQLLLYKQFFSEQENYKLDNIDIEYFIVKRKLYPNADFPQKKIQTFAPAHGKVSMNRVTNSLHNFLNNGFDKNSEFKVNQIATPSKSSCKWCEFNQTEYCDKGIR